MIRLRVPGALGYRDLFLRVVAAACKLSRGEPAESSRPSPAQAEFDSHVISAAGEAFNNICIHGYREREGDIDAEIDPRPDGIVIRLVDTGATFNPLDHPPPSLESLHESGMGLFIMKSFMEVAYEGGPPNVLRLTKRRQTNGSHARPGSLLGEAESIRSRTQ